MSGQNRFLEQQRSVGNHGVGAILEREASAKGATLRRDARMEGDADATAERVVANRPEYRGRRDAETARTTNTAPSSVIRNASAATGRHDPLPPSLRDRLQEHFGRDLGDVRVHHDEQANESASRLSARAFTLGADIHLANGEYAPDTDEGARLIAHEVAHVVQQRQFGAALQRQPAPGRANPLETIPQDLQVSPDMTHMTDDALARRHDRILKVLDKFTESSADTDALFDQAGHIGVELARRKALAAGRTFTEDAITKMRDYFVANAKKPQKPETSPPPAPAGGWQDSCIVALNKGMKIVTGQPKLPTTPETIEKTMDKIAAGGFAGSAREVWFESKGGKISKGGARPERLHESVWDALIALSGGDPGWSVFTMSVFDGNHSVTLTLDAKDPGAPKVYWSDQWSTKQGWKAYTRSTLDGEVTRLVQMWWDKQLEGKKFPPVIRLWRVRAVP